MSTGPFFSPEIDARWAVECKQQADDANRPFVHVIDALRADLAVADKRYATLAAENAALRSQLTAASMSDPAEEWARDD